MSGDEVERPATRDREAGDPDGDDLAGGDGLTPAEEVAHWASVRELQQAIDRLKREKLSRIDGLLRSACDGILAPDRLWALADEALARAIERQRREPEPGARLPAAVHVELLRAISEELEGRARVPRDAPEVDGEAGWVRERLGRDEFERCLRDPCDGEEGLWRAIEEGRNARERLTRRYLPLAYGLARAMMGRGRDLQDLRQEAFLGLRKAILGYRPGSGAQFSTFATRVIRHHLSDFIRAASPTGAYAARQIASYREQCRCLSEQLGCPPSADEVYRRLGWGDRRRKSFERLVRLTGGRSPESIGGRPGEIPDGRESTTPLDELSAREEQERLHGALRRLGEPARSGETITVQDIRQLGSIPPDTPVLEINLQDNTERTLADDEVVPIKPGHGFAKKVRYQRGGGR